MALLLLGGLLLALGRCKKDEAEPPDDNNQQQTDPCDTLNVTFANDVEPIINQSCALAACHGSGSATGGYNFDDYQGTKTSADNNILLCVINHKAGCKPMPQGGSQLSEIKRLKIECWVEEGAPNN